MTGPVVAVLVLLAGLAALTGHTLVNATRWLRRPAERPAVVDEPVAVLLPLRDEAARVTPCLRALLAQRGVPGLRIMVLDDGSTDGTAEVVRAVVDDDRRRHAGGHPVVGADRRVTVLTGVAPPPGWLGKPHACHQLAQRADPAATALVFVDADVVLAPDAVAAAVAELRAARVTLLSPYPRILVATVGDRLVQPLLQWLWLTFLPLRAMERSARPSLAAAGGQFLVVDRAGYTAAGGHAAVRDRVLEDIELARAVKRAGGRIALADGSRLADCRMYDTWPQLRDGYTKSLWASFGHPGAAAAVLTLFGLLYVAPPLLVAAALVAGAPTVAALAAAGYLLGVAGRVVSARATGGRWWPDALAHPVSVVVLGWLTVRSYHLRKRRRLSWRGRPVG
ncbi:Glycosyltransferase, catalytic subunit of cellulose synthase and poly-beta-1,6-N-acetylglucosamine synthase [Micromonospora pallida]|uniref:Glycosyltransferase, catalytic subunit of cellulose synthase and poly-beta-1,6-N-acetylglucosamine synthase n=1 Tax=Micromonospora pallida TaxID=145854 RepID=A0A1C6RMH7_9ACTN|nr:glycosyltransferase family 2 protein [Micromonospora pallida]SCL18257.1 Glycosyltransferase, catalytic subunit of cellulose synthase and poly-beta-1,6-N-acetylglucosamine synthase [Micromonospora pallida]